MQNMDGGFVRLVNGLEVFGELLQRISDGGLKIDLLVTPELLDQLTKLARLSVEAEGGVGQADDAALAGVDGSPRRFLLILREFHQDISP